MTELKATDSVIVYAIILVRSFILLNKNNNNDTLFLQGENIRHTNKKKSGLHVCRA